MSDERLGIVRLALPDGRTVALQVTYEALDAIGYAGVIDLLKVVQKGRAGSQAAMAELLAVMSAGAISVDDVRSSPVAAFPTSVCLQALWDCWSLAQYGPDGRPAEDGAENPPKSRRPTLLSRLFGRR